MRLLYWIITAAIMLTIIGVVGADPTPPPTLKPYGTPTPTPTVDPGPVITIGPPKPPSEGCSISVILVDCYTYEPIDLPIPWSIGNGMTGFGPTSSPIPVECEKELYITLGCYVDEHTGEEVWYGQSTYIIKPTGNLVYVLPVCPLDEPIYPGNLTVCAYPCVITADGEQHLANNTWPSTVPVSFYIFNTEYPEGLAVGSQPGSGCVYLEGEYAGGHYYACAGAPGHYWSCNEFTQNGSTTVNIGVCRTPYNPIITPHPTSPQPTPTPCYAAQCVKMNSDGSCPDGGYTPYPNVMPGESGQVCCRNIEVPCSSPYVTPYPTPIPPTPHPTLPPTPEPTPIPNATEKCYYQECVSAQMISNSGGTGDIPYCVTGALVQKDGSYLCCLESIQDCSDPCVHPGNWMYPLNNPTHCYYNSKYTISDEITCPDGFIQTDVPDETGLGNNQTICTDSQYLGWCGDNCKSPPVTPTPIPTTPPTPGPTWTIPPTRQPTGQPTPTLSPGPTPTSPIPPPYPTPYPTHVPTWIPTPVPTGSPSPSSLIVTTNDRITNQKILDPIQIRASPGGMSLTSSGSAQFSYPSPTAVGVEALESAGYYGGWASRYVSQLNTGLTLPLDPKITGSIRVTVKDARTKTIITNSTIPVSISTLETKQITTGSALWSPVDFGVYQISTDGSADYHGASTHVYVTGSEEVTLHLYPKLDCFDTTTPMELLLSAYDLRNGLDIADRSVLYTFASGQSGSGYPDARFSLPCADYTVTASADEYYSSSVTFTLQYPMEVPIGLEPIPSHSLTVCAVDAETGKRVSTPVTVDLSSVGSRSGSECVAFDQISPGLYDVDIQATGYFSAGGQVMVQGPTSVTYYLYPVPGYNDLKLTVRCLDAYSGAGISDTYIALSTGKTGYTDSGGYVKFTGLSPGTYTVTASASGYYGASGTLGIFSDVEYTVTLYPEYDYPFDPTTPITISVNSYDALTLQRLSTGYIVLKPIWLANQSTGGV